MIAKVRYCQENDTSWTACGGGSNSITTTSGVITTFCVLAIGYLYEWCGPALDILTYLILR